jgi:hypothetical protein
LMNSLLGDCKLSSTLSPLTANTLNSVVSQTLLG